MEEPNIDIGWIGLDSIGWPLAACLAKKGHRLLVRDSDPALSILFVEEYAKCRVATSDPDSFQNCEIVITMLSDGKEVYDVLLGAHGVAPHLRPGSIIVDMSLCSPFQTRALGLELSRLRVDLIDSPIAQPKDQQGVTLMVGSDTPESLEKVMPILKDMSASVFCVGGLGAGSTTKALDSYVNAARMVAFNDALITGQKLGLDAQTIIDVMNLGISSSYQKHLQENPQSHKSDYPLEHLIKDVKIANDVIEKSGFRTELPTLVEKYLEESLQVVEKEDDCKEQPEELRTDN